MTVLKVPDRDPAPLTGFSGPSPRGGTLEHDHPKLKRHDSTQDGAQTIHDCWWLGQFASIGSIRNQMLRGAWQSRQIKSVRRRLALSAL